MRRTRTLLLAVLLVAGCTNSTAGTGASLIKPAASDPAAVATPDPAASVSGSAAASTLVDIGAGLQGPAGMKAAVWHNRRRTSRNVRVQCRRATVASERGFRRHEHGWVHLVSKSRVPRRSRSSTACTPSLASCGRTARSTSRHQVESTRTPASRATRSRARRPSSRCRPASVRPTASCCRVPAGSSSAYRRRATPARP